MKKDKLKNEEIKEINKHLSNGLKHWAELLIMANADEWAYYLDFNDEDFFHALWIFNSVAQNIAIKSDYLNGKNVEGKGVAFRNAIKDFCGIDPVELTKKLLENEDKAS